LVKEGVRQVDKIKRTEAYLMMRGKSSIFPQRRLVFFYRETRHAHAHTVINDKPFTSHMNSKQSRRH
jgi:hypothetical protein